jgi:membrane protease YdiL (CAAX protease family)
MTKSAVTTVAIAIALGLTFFAVIMGAAIGLISVNASRTPELVWFPLPVTAVLVTALWLAQRYWKIGLDWPQPRTTRVTRAQGYAIGVALTLLGVAACAVQGKFSGYTRATELFESGVSPLFEFTYAIYMAVFAAVLAEATFRGVMQTRMQQVLSVWPLVITIGIINVFAHRWGPEITHNGLGLFVVLAAWTYLRWLTESLWPPLIMHAGINLIVALGLWFGGPLDHSTTPFAIVAVVAACGLAALAYTRSVVTRVNT